MRETRKLPNIERSRELLRRAGKIIPGATQTFAKGPLNYVQGISPVFASRARGTRIWDVDGNEFLDLNMAIGPISLGYCDPEVDEAIRTQLEKGITFSLPHELELQVAEMIHEWIPGAESVRFSKTGADVTSAAIRLARAFTKRNKVLCCGYHGWHDWYISSTPRNAGIPGTTGELVQTFRYNDLETLSKLANSDTACVILEPVLFDEPKSGFLHEVRKLCTERGILLIFDEMWTGFRIANGGAQEFFDVKADLATFSKAIANGMPLSVLTGRADVLNLLEETVFFYTTFGGEALSLAAALKTMELIKKHDVCRYIADLGAVLKQEIDRMIVETRIEGVKCLGMPFRTMLSFESPNDPLISKSFVQQELLRRGVLWSGTHTLSYAHTAEDISYLVDCYWEIFRDLKDLSSSGKVAEALEGAPVQAPFRTTTGKAGSQR